MMRFSSRSLTLLATVCLLSVPPHFAAAQGTAMAEARTRVVCGSGTLVSANYLPGGMLQATCRQNTARTASQSGNTLGQGGLSNTAIAGGVIGSIVILGALTGNSNDDTYTSDTTSAGTYYPE
ncbi:hypothetical protein [Arenibacterium sp. LLYu02]|uniref:hypothetical protein n=1 Tax=Arenibacterium sp. LLYu02 TaxID=3404132 RepID=UPI003B212E3E